MSNAQNIPIPAALADGSPTPVKSILARLLAAESIRLVHDPKAQTASFNLSTRVLTLPRWGGATIHLYDMLVGHEVGHALWTEKDGWRSTIEALALEYKIPEQAASGYLNIVEDARIERLIQTKFPGMRRDFYHGYMELVKTGKFKDILDKLSTLQFGDRLNMHAKVGVHTHTPLNTTWNIQEQKIWEQVNSTLTWTDVVRATKSLLDYDSTNEGEKMESQEYSGATVKLGKGEGGDGEEVEMEDDGTGDKGVAGGAGGITTPITIDAIEDAIEQSAKQKNREYSYETSVITTLDFDEIPDDVVIPWRTTIPDSLLRVIQGKTHHNQTLAPTAKESKEVPGHRGAVTAMTTAFEQKKAAERWKRTSIAKTGTLDTLRMQSWKWNEDIFRRQTRVSDGKNHGIVILVDWSGSMSGTMGGVLEQLFILCDFCKRTQIPFEVLAFSTNMWKDNGNGNMPSDWSNSPNVAQPSQGVQLLGMLSSEMPGPTYKAAKTMFASLSTLQSHDARWRLANTPTCGALYACSDFVSKFIQRTNLQVCHTIVLTDGEPSDDFINSGAVNQYREHYIFRDPKTGATYRKVTYCPTLTSDHPDVMTGLKPKLTPAQAHDQYEKALGSGASVWPEGKVRHWGAWIAGDVLRRRTGTRLHWIGLLTSVPGEIEVENKKTWSHGWITGKSAGWTSCTVVDPKRFQSCTPASDNYYTKQSEDEFEDQMRRKDDEKWGMLRAQVASGKSGKSLYYKAFAEQQNQVMASRSVGTVIGSILAGI